MERHRGRLPEAYTSRYAVLCSTSLLLTHRLCKGMTLWQHPNFFAYFPTAGTFEGMLGDLYSTSTPNPGFNVRHHPSIRLRHACVY